MNTFDDLYVLDLHGNSNKKERTPDGGKDENVFDIMQGVSIGIFIKKPSSLEKRVYKADLYGSRADKYKTLWESDISKTEWKEVNPQTPFYLFASQQEDIWDEYKVWNKITEIMLTHSVGILTSRDELTIKFSQEEVLRTVKDFY